MGFRSVMITNSQWTPVPKWFQNKYPEMSFRSGNEGKTFPASILYERKFYQDISSTELFVDIQKVLNEDNSAPYEYDWVFPIVLLHECGGITLVHITKNAITAREPIGWKDVERVEHDYCYDCSYKKP